MTWKSKPKRLIHWNGIRHRCIKIDSEALGRADRAVTDVDTLRAAARGASAKLKQWRRHALQRKGAGLHTSLATDPDRVSLAMLDADGVVVCWYDNGYARNRTDDHVTHRHFSQFYAADAPSVDELDKRLTLAIGNGVTAHEGWLKRADGSVDWGRTFIAPILLRSGCLQGFSHVTEWRRGQVSRSESMRPSRPSRETISI